MPTLRIIPPRLLAQGGGPPAPDDLAAFYFGQLWRHWSARDRMVAAILGCGDAAANAGAFAAGAGAWRHGWDARAQAMVGNASPAAFLDMRARKGINRLLNPVAFPLAANPLKNKHLFARRCDDAGLPVPQSFSGRVETLADWIGRRRTMVVKPNFSSKGRGIVRYARTAKGWSAGRESLTPNALLERIATAVAGGAIVQDCVETHRDLAVVSPGALPTLRIMTCLDETGAPEVCGTVLRLSAGGEGPVDNFQAGNLAVAIVHGACGRAYRRRDGAIEVLEAHPSTGALVAGRPVPDLRAACELAVAAHRAFDGFTVIGWDVGLGASGPVLIEGNWNPGTDVLQMVGGEGVGATRLGRLYRHHLMRVPAERWRSARPYQRDGRAVAGGSA